MKSEKDVAGIVRSRRREAEEVALTDEQVREIEAERDVLVKDLEAAPDEPEETPEAKARTEEVRRLAGGLGARLKQEVERSHAEDEQRLAQIKEGLAPFAAMVETAYEKCQALEREWGPFLKELRTIEWDALTARYPRGVPPHNRIVEVEKLLGEAVSLIEYAARKRGQIIADIEAASLHRVLSDRHYLPELRWQAENFAHHPGGLKSTLWQLRQASKYLEEALARLEKESAS